MALSLTGCQRGCASFKRSMQATKRSYHVQLYSGGCLIHEDHFFGIVHEDETSQAFYFVGDTMYELRGDYIISSY